MSGANTPTPRLSQPAVEASLIKLKLQQEGVEARNLVAFSVSLASDTDDRDGDFTVVQSRRTKRQQRGSANPRTRRTRSNHDHKASRNSADSHQGLPIRPQTRKKKQRHGNAQNHTNAGPRTSSEPSHQSRDGNTNQAPPSGLPSEQTVLPSELGRPTSKTAAVQRAPQPRSTHKPSAEPRRLAWARSRDPSGGPGLGSTARPASLGSQDGTLVGRLGSMDDFLDWHAHSTGSLDEDDPEQLERRRDFAGLIERFKVEKNMALSPNPPKAVAWDIRKSSRTPPVSLMSSLNSTMLSNMPLTAVAVPLLSCSNKLPRNNAALWAALLFGNYLVSRLIQWSLGLALLDVGRFVAIHQARSRREESEERLKAVLEFKHAKAQELRQHHLNEVRQKGKMEDEKSREIAFIQKLDSEMRKLEVEERSRHADERRERIEAQRRERAHQESQRLQAARQRRKTQAADRIARLQQKDEERRRRVAEHEHRRLSTRRTSRPMSADSDSGPLRLAAIFDVDGSLNIPTRNEETIKQYRQKLKKLRTKVAKLRPAETTMPCDAKPMARHVSTILAALGDHHAKPVEDALEQLRKGMNHALLVQPRDVTERDVHSGLWTCARVLQAWMSRPRDVTPRAVELACELAYKLAAALFQRQCAMHTAAQGPTSNDALLGGCLHTWLDALPQLVQRKHVADDAVNKLAAATDMMVTMFKRLAGDLGRVRLRDVLRHAEYIGLPTLCLKALDACLVVPKDADWSSGAPTTVLARPLPHGLFCLLACVLLEADRGLGSGSDCKTALCQEVLALEGLFGACLQYMTEADIECRTGNWFRSGDPALIVSCITGVGLGCRYSPSYRAGLGTEAVQLLCELPVGTTAPTMTGAVFNAVLWLAVWDDLLWQTLLSFVKPAVLRKRLQKQEVTLEDAELLVMATKLIEKSKFEQLGDLYYRMKNYAAASGHYEESIRFLHSHYHETKDKRWLKAMVELSLHLADCKMHQGEPETAESGYRWCVETAEELVHSSSSIFAEESEELQALYGMSLEEYSNFLLLRAEYADDVSRHEVAQRCEQQAVRAYEAAKGLQPISHSTEARCLSTASMAAQLDGDYKKARKYALETLGLCRQENCADMSLYEELLKRIEEETGANTAGSAMA
ncbi:uncharacterized protein MONBRDRAFT_8364 [Monosiga brevicollis MX1]|uniref:Uncharacterized protein n=1 Tax=Monosiga brevicollis TaxID=81824 RepID=A9UZV1_MONBE|nr:uncharacterized protein MONBRDRAFT_8364 [Monosiga brevicollis MX1]EDQ89299.1 predicted protein [Monosiga brevicollis MX1]|eukprot:XP_001745875.1 hypothetical protein [Monosiga brevicollis MX1]